METTFVSQKTTFSHEPPKKLEKREHSPLFTREKKKEKFSRDIENASFLVLREALDEEKEGLEGGIASPLMPLQGSSPSFFSISSVRSVDIAPALLELFEKGVNAMAHLNASGISETTFFLDTPQFAGAKIVITEFNTAPKAFNISLIGAPEMVARFNLYAPDLIAAFQKSPFDFTVHRLESDIDLHLVQRKEDLSDQKEDEEKR